MIISILASLILIGFFSGYEIGFVSANRLSLELKKKNGDPSGKIIAKFLEAPTQFIGTCLIGLNILKGRRLAICPVSRLKSN